MRVEAAGFHPQNMAISLTTREDANLVALRRANEETDSRPPVPYTELISSGVVPSGQRGNFSVWYEVTAPPPRPGYVIDVERSSYYLVGDRQCGAWAECAWGDHDESKLSFHFRLQGHSEDASTGVRMSQGFLRVSYKPR